ncbi:hypothetical protein [Sphingomonas sp. SUN039]|uniref:hypothetical protein n=1 Tax=Sphingomonas sp. SUN039 TaxID=2937787 RepID=UPI002164C464|nr:hypothetical protein [Sphingomonas sp. SUN039]UVO53361.1 hypothetical protein M0209_04210 [Sphingomonas sp. SUN039]
MFGAAGFREDLKARFDLTQGVTVFHTANVPKKCVNKAIKLVRQAGFNDVRAEVGSVDLGPPR